MPILGAYTVTESALAGWTLSDLVCTGAGEDSTTDTGNRTATLDIDPGEVVVCTFSNTKDGVVPSDAPSQAPTDAPSDGPTFEPTQDQGGETTIPTQADSFSEGGLDGEPRGMDTLVLLIGLIAAAGLMLVTTPRKAPR